MFTIEFIACKRAKDAEHRENMTFEYVLSIFKYPVDDVSEKWKVRTVELIFMQFRPT